MQNANFQTMKMRPGPPKNYETYNLASQSPNTHQVTLHNPYETVVVAHSSTN